MAAARAWQTQRGRRREGRSDVWQFACAVDLLHHQLQLFTVLCVATHGRSVQISMAFVNNGSSPLSTPQHLVHAACPMHGALADTTPISMFNAS